MEAESEDDTAASQTPLERPAPHRGNTMVHVCWHRNTSVSMVDFSVAVEVPSTLGPAPPLLPRRFPVTVSDPVPYIRIRLDYLCGNGVLLLCCNNGECGSFLSKHTALTPSSISNLWDLDQDFSCNIHIEALPYLPYISDIWDSEPAV